MRAKVLPARAQMLVSKYGREVKIVAKQEPTYTINQSAVAYTPRSAVVRAVVSFSSSAMDGDQSERQRAVLHVAAKDVPFEPKVHDQVLFDGVSWVVTACTVNEVGGNRVTYTITAQRA